jgi:hypothetical protein
MEVIVDTATNLTEQDLRDMKLHDIKYIDEWMILRVPNGWIYTMRDMVRPHSIFVPLLLK